MTNFILYKYLRNQDGVTKGTPGLLIFLVGYRVGPNGRFQKLASECKMRAVFFKARVLHLKVG